MHERHLFTHILRYLEEEEKKSSRHIKKICIALSEFGGLRKEHFLEHFKEAAGKSRWGSLEIEFTRVPVGPEFEITKIVFEK